MQSLPPSPSITSAPELPRIKSLPAVPVNVPAPLTMLVRSIDAQAAGLRSLILMYSPRLMTRVDGTVLVAAIAVTALIRIKLSMLDVMNRIGRNRFNWSLFYGSNFFCTVVVIDRLPTYAPFTWLA